jgi:apolipoprotein N-acyltransferase
MLAKFKKQPVLVGLVVWYFLMWVWAFQTDMLDLAGSKMQGYILAVFIVAVNVALAAAIMYNMIRLVRRLHQSLPLWMVIASTVPLFALADFSVAWIPAALWIGPQGLLDSVLPLSSPGLIVVHTPWLFAARLVGFYTLGGLVWGTLYLIWNRQYRRWSYVPLVGLSLIALLGWGLYRQPNGSTFTARIVSEDLKNRVPSVHPTDEKLVIFPEYGLEKVTNKNLSERIIKSSLPPTYFLGSEQIYYPQLTGHRNRMVFGNTRDGITEKQDKYRLIPGGEDMPYIIRTLLRATNQVETLNYFSYAKGVLRGDKQMHPFVVDGQTRVAACSSIISPQDYRDFARSGATVFTNSASLTIFKGSRLFAWQQKSLGKFMAVANARFFLQSANSATAYAFSSNGQLLKEVRGRQTARITVRNNTQKTFYTLVGDWVPVGGGLIVLGWIVGTKPYRRPGRKQLPKKE